jgi:hypothetical protein
MRLTNKEFLAKLKAVAKETEEEKPIEVYALRHVVPTFLESKDGEGTEIVQSVAVHLKFSKDGEDYETTERVLFNKYGEADLTKLKLWQKIVEKRKLKNVQPIKSLRTGSI